jgi:hypothetical protein
VDQGEQTLAIVRIDDTRVGRLVVAHDARIPLNAAPSPGDATSHVCVVGPRRDCRLPTE